MSYSYLLPSSQRRMKLENPHLVSVVIYHQSLSFWDFAQSPFAVGHWFPLRTVENIDIIYLHYSFSHFADDAADLANNLENIKAVKPLPTLEETINRQQERSNRNNIVLTEDDTTPSKPLVSYKDGSEDKIVKNRITERDIYVRIAPVARITSEDVMKQVLKVQQKLEEYNSKRRESHRNQRDLKSV